MDPQTVCPVAARCGGCPSLGSPASDQRSALVARVEGALRRPVTDVIMSPRQLGYRARVSLTRGPDGRPGYHVRGAHGHVAIDGCPIARDEVHAVIRRLPALPRALERFELASDGDGVVLHADGAPRVRQAVASLDIASLGLRGAAAGSRTTAGDARLQLQVAGIDHHISPGTFTQVNLEVNALLVARVVSAVHELAPDPGTLLDLYAGCGNLSLPLVAQGWRAVLIERAGSAGRDARRTAARHGLDVDVRSGNADRFEAGQAFFDVAVLDPPRKGAPGVVPQLLTTRPRGIVYVSCNPRTLGRDIQPALAAGYEVVELVAIDMFPQTDHAEVLCVLRR